MAEHGPWAWSRLYGGLACALGVAVCGAAVVTLDAPQPLRAVAACGLVLWAPGFALTMVVFVPGAIGGVERALLAFAASVALTAIPAILLEATGVRLDTASFLITGCVVTSLAAVPALLRLRPLTDVPGTPPGSRPPLAPIATAIGIGLVLAGAVVTARITPQPAGIPGSSALAATSAGPVSMRAEVISAELETTAYRLTMSTGAGPVELARFTLPPGGSWAKALDRPGSKAIELSLYRGAEQRPYRRVVLPGAD
jgi:Protein of unknown function (DUF1616)